MERDVHPQSVKTFMTSPVISVRADEPVAEAAKTLIRKGISGAPVVDDDGNLVGILSEQDCMRILASEAFHALPAGTVQQHMTKDVEPIDVDADLFHVVFIFNGRAYKRLPVVENGRLVGIVTRRDALKALERIAEERAALPRLETTYDKIAARRG